MIYAVVAALGWGALSGYVHLPYWIVAIGAPIVAGAGFWLERERLTRSAPANRRDFFLLLAAAYAFVSLVTLGLVSLTYALVPLLLHR
jgi:hypothetical protein